MTVIEANEKAKRVELAAKEREALWENRRTWVMGHVFPVIKALLNDDMLKATFGQLSLYAGNRPTTAVCGDDMRKLGKGGYGPHHGLGFLPVPICARTVLINPGVADNYQFMVGVLGDVDGNSWLKQYRPGAKPFSLAFAATGRYTPNGHDGFTPKNIKCVGLPGSNDDAKQWIRAQIKKHWDYWLENNVKTPSLANVGNEHYTPHYNFIFPKVIDL